MVPTRTLRRLLEAIPLSRYDGTLYRVVRADTLYGFSTAGPYKPRPLFNLGPSSGGARYTPQGGAPALYMAEDVDTSLREYLQVATPAPLKPSSTRSAMVIYSATVTLEAILDLTIPSIRTRLGTTLAELASPWRYRRDRRKPPTHRLGSAAAAAAHIQGVRFPSTRGSGACVVIFTDALTPSTFVEVNDPHGNLVEKLP